MEKITADTFAKFNRTCELDRADRAEKFYELALDLNNTPEQARYWARKAARPTKPRRRHLEAGLVQAFEPSLSQKIRSAIRDMVSRFKK